MKIFVPSNFREEREYIIRTIFEYFLNIKVVVEYKNIANYVINVNESKRIIVKDFFWNTINEESYLQSKYIPDNITFIKNDFISEKNLPIIYGSDEFYISKEEIICGVDVFASAFFMLSRWEECLENKRDKHERFIEENSLILKAKLNERPIVNEYVEFIWNLLFEMDDTLVRKKHNYNLIITHDVDEISRYKSVNRLFRAIAGDLILRKNPFNVFYTLAEYLLVKLKIQKDPYDTFDWLMDASEEINKKSYFYFVPAIVGEEDFQYSIEDQEIKNILNNVVKRGHNIGIHGSYGAFNDRDRFSNELNRLKKIFKSVSEGRQHFLRFENPTTWQIWEDVGLKISSNMGFYNTYGFRSGICYDYPVFNVKTRRQLKLIERPLILMEGPIVYENLKKEEFVDVYKRISETVKKYGGNLIILWHTNTIKHPYWEKYSKYYKEILSIIK